MTDNKSISENYKNDMQNLLNEADVLISNTIIKINHELINLYWNLGKIIVEFKERNASTYGNYVVKRFNEELYAKYGVGFNRPNIYRAIQFYEMFPMGIRDQIVSPGRQSQNIHWSHIRETLQFKDIRAVNYYLNEVENKSLTKRQLIDEIKVKAYERTIANQRKGEIKNEIEKTLKDPVILNIKDKKRTEKELENEIVSNILGFMNEIGDNIFWGGRQYKININGLIYRVDLVLYDKDNKYYILIDLKINKVSQKDISQMKFYVDYFNQYRKAETDKNTIGLILVETKDIRIEKRDDIYQIKYLSELPKEKELLKIINENKIILLKTEKLKLDSV